MWISRLSVSNIKSFEGLHTLQLSKNINILVGKNNSGKSTLINAAFFLQNANAISSSDIRIEQSQGMIEIDLKDIKSFSNKYGVVNLQFPTVKSTFTTNGRSVIAKSQSGSEVSFTHLPNKEPQNFIYPYLSKRKVTGYDDRVNSEATNSVTGNFQFLHAKIARLCNINHPNSHKYQKACADILGFLISNVDSDNGQKAAYIIEAFQNIPLSSMGEGVPNLLGLIVDLCMTDKKLFLIEEPENDIHPQALKALLSLIQEKASDNQFIISTHSNIVTKYLGSVKDAKVFNVSMTFSETTRQPLSEVKEVENDPASRLRLLEDLGYEAFDFGQWKAWLFLEESSAEVIIKDFLIPTFLGDYNNILRTFSARSVSEVEPKFKDFNNLFVFIHLEQMYKNKAWVLIDAGETEAEIIKKLKETYTITGWNENNFLQLKEHDFERYYPDRFTNEVNQILKTTDKNQKRSLKKVLLDNVKEWIKNSPMEAKEEFSVSAKEVIDLLTDITKQI